MQKFTHPTYTINHTCGHSITKQVLEASEYKRLQVVRAMSAKKCNECIKSAAK